MAEIDRPIFMIGTGRSGTTVGYQLLIRHPALAWYSSYDLRFPDAGWAHIAKRIQDVPGLRTLAANSQRGIAARPVEPFALMDQDFPGFGEPYRNLRASDLTPWARKRLRTRIAARMKQEGRPRFAMKWTGWSRAGFMDAAFPDARFIHIHRDGCAVANSLLQQPWWRGWQGPSQWRWGPLSAQDDALWRAHDESFVVLAGIQWRLCYEEIEASLAAIPTDRVHSLAYEDLCTAPMDRMRALFAFVDLPFTREVEQAVAGISLRNDAVDRWRKDLNPEQADALEVALGPALAKQRAARGGA